MAVNDEIVQLIIDAKNLSSDELKAAAADVDRLGQTARESEKELNQLKIDQTTIASFEQAGAEVRELKKELALAEVEFDKLSAALKKNTEATDAERLAVKQAKIALTEQRKELAQQQRAYNKLSNEAKALGVHTRNIEESQQKLAIKTRELTERTNQLSAEYRQQAQELKAKVATERQSQAALESYRAGLIKLNQQLDEGVLSHRAYTKAEKELRASLHVTEKQAKETATAIERESQSKSKKVASTDALTSAMRGLTVAYGAFLSAQRAGQAIADSVKEYGALEAAITKVQKTTDLSRTQLLAMTDVMQELAAKTTPTATNELLRYAEVAGQLGVKGTQSLLDVATASDALAVSTNLAGDEAATLLARMLAMTGEGIENIHGLSSSLVDLGNNVAANEQEIAHMTKEIITGTRALDLGSAAAAGFGATLMEAGQRAERSRSAMFRLSQIIKKASVEGGEDLERLQKITGMTADEIETNLGDRPEEVLIRFVAGLQKSKEQGVLVSKVMADFGETSTETVSVVESLAGMHERLAEVVDRSKSAFADQNKHFEEAAKAYADQESALGRLANRFTELQAKVGEAFADETNNMVGEFNSLLDQQSGKIVALSEYVGEFLEGLWELGEALYSFADGIGVIDGLLVAFLALKSGINAISAALNYSISGYYELAAAIADAMGGSAEEVAQYQAKASAALQRVQQDLIDIASVSDDAMGKSSASFRDLQSAIEKNKTAVESLAKANGGLTDSERAVLEQVIQTGHYNKENEETYRQLTAAVVKQSRSLEILGEMEKQQAERQKQQLALSQQKAEHEKQVAEAVKASAGEVAILNDRMALLKTQRELGLVTDADYAKQEFALKEAIHSVGLANEKALILESAKNEAYQNSSSLTSDLAARQRELTNQLNQLKSGLQAATQGSIAYEEAARKIAVTEKELEQTKKNLQIAQELEGKTLSQLLIYQRQHQQEIDKLNLAKKAGTITAAEYAAEMEKLSFVTDFLKKAIGDAADETSRGTVAVKESTEAVKENTEAVEENAQQQAQAATAVKSTETAVSAWAMLYQRLNKELDYSGETTDDLTSKLKELDQQYRVIRVTATGWWDDILRMNNEAVKREQDTIRQTLQLRDYIDQIERGSLSIDQMTSLAERANTKFDLLGDNQLEPLRNAIEAAKREFESLSQTIDSQFSNIEDRLDALLGKEEDIMRRKFEREMQELLELLEQAKASGDQALVAKINEAIRNLKKAQELEFREAFGEGANSTGTSSNSATRSGSQSGLSYNVNLNLPSGNTTTVQVASDADAMALVNALQSLGNTHRWGIG